MTYEMRSAHAKLTIWATHVRVIVCVRFAVHSWSSLTSFSSSSSSLSNISHWCTVSLIAFLRPPQDSVSPRGSRPRNSRQLTCTRSLALFDLAVCSRSFAPQSQPQFRISLRGSCFWRRTHKAQISKLKAFLLRRHGHIVLNISLPCNSSSCSLALFHFWPFRIWRSSIRRSFAIWIVRLCRAFLLNMSRTTTFESFMSFCSLFWTCLCELFCWRFVFCLYFFFSASVSFLSYCSFLSFRLRLCFLFCLASVCVVSFSLRFSCLRVCVFCSVFFLPQCVFFCLFRVRICVLLSFSRPYLCSFASVSVFFRLRVCVLSSFFLASVCVYGNISTSLCSCGCAIRRTSTCAYDNSVSDVATLTVPWDDWKDR